MPLEFVTFDDFELASFSRFQIGRRRLAANDADILEVGNRLGIGLIDVDGEDAATVLTRC